MTDEEQIAAKLAELDQLKAGCREMAETIGGYFNALLAAGCERGEALALTLNYQSLLLAAAFSKPE